MPVAAAKLTVSDDMQSCSFLLGNKIADGLVLDGFKFIGTDDALVEVVASPMQDIRAQEAADDVEAEGRSPMERHERSSRLKFLNTNEFAKPQPYRKLPRCYQHL